MKKITVILCLLPLFSFNTNAQFIFSPPPNGLSEALGILNDGSGDFSSYGYGTRKIDDKSVEIQSCLHDDNIKRIIISVGTHMQDLTAIIVANKPYLKERVEKIFSDAVDIDKNNNNILKRANDGLKPFKNDSLPKGDEMWYDEKHHLYWKITENNNTLYVFCFYNLKDGIELEKTALSVINAELNAPEMKFEHDTINLGVIKSDALNKENKIIYNISFTNVGNEPLIISNVTSLSTYKIISWSKEKITKGNKGNIQVKFNLIGFRGHDVIGAIKISSNAQNSYRTIYAKISVSN